jgi:hypothetical protein
MLEERLVFIGPFITPAVRGGSAAATVFAIVLSAAVLATCHLFWLGSPPPRRARPGEY